MLGFYYFFQLVRRISSPMLQACFDTGHGNLNGYSLDRAANILRDVPIACTHAHDNNGVSDDHSVPGTGTIDWSRARHLPQEALRRVVVEIDCKAGPRVCGLHIVAAFAATRQLLLGHVEKP